MNQEAGYRSLVCALVAGAAQGLAHAALSGSRRPQDMEGLIYVLGLMMIWPVIGLGLVVGVYYAVKGLRTDDSRAMAVLALVLNLVVGAVAYHRWLAPKVQEAAAAVDAERPHPRGEREFRKFVDERLRVRFKKPGDKVPLSMKTCTFITKSGLGHCARARAVGKLVLTAADTYELDLVVTIAGTSRTFKGSTKHPAGGSPLMIKTKSPEGGFTYWIDRAEMELRFGADGQIYTVGVAQGSSTP